MKPINLIPIVFIAYCFIAGCQSENSTPKRPNILFAIADDASWKHFGAYGCDWVKTPAFDKVAESGILFTRAYTPNSKCAPSRSCIITGRNSWQLEDAANHWPLFPEKFKSYAEVLGDNGYWVGSVAKGWSPGIPGKINGKSRELTGPMFNEFRTTPPAKYISNYDYARNFEAFLTARPAGLPFCFWYGSTEPHLPYEYGVGSRISGKSIDEIDKVPTFWPDVDTVRQNMLDYAFEIEYFDQHLQMMLEKLDEIGELENTLVVVTADNGMPLPRIKGQVYEYSNHLPMAIMWPNGIKNPGRTVDDLVSFIDFAPTFLELARVEAATSGMQPITGISLTDIFYSEKEGLVNPIRDFVLVGKERHDIGRPNDQGYPVRGIVMHDYLFLKNFKPDRWPSGNPETGYLNTDASPTKTFVLDTRRKEGIMKYWQYNFGKRPVEELYNIIQDPYCLNNLADDPDFLEVKNKMETDMNSHLKEQEDPRILGYGDVFDNYKNYGPHINYYERYMGGKEVPKAGWVDKSDYDSDFIEK